MRFVLLLTFAAVGWAGEHRTTSAECEAERLKYYAQLEAAGFRSCCAFQGNTGHGSMNSDGKNSRGLFQNRCGWTDNRTGEVRSISIIEIDGVYCELPSQPYAIRPIWTFWKKQWIFPVAPLWLAEEPIYQACLAGKLQRVKP